ncbi:MAG: response regulator transcription factor [Anaerolineae bacterium]|nr:response regulator transcription factor [Anaerolineae bacterium]
MATILVVDDEENILNLVKAYLKVEGHATYTAEDGTTGLAMFRRYHPDLVILDVMLPEMDGFEVLQQIRQESQVYVLMLTARGEEPDRIAGFMAGADDYLTKPFSPRELVVRVQAILRRGRGLTDEQVLEVGDLRIDSQRHEVWRGDNRVDLTALEFKLLKTLAGYPGMVLSRERLIELVWGYDFFGDDRVVDVHIGRIRQKLESDAANPRYIHTIRGVGYKFEDVQP